MLECKNPNNNPKCRKTVHTKNGLCRSCMLKGRTYEDIYGDRAQEEIDKRGYAENVRKLHRDGVLRPYYFTGNRQFYSGSLYEYWIDKYGEDVGNEKIIQHKQKTHNNWLDNPLSNPESSSIYRQLARETRRNWTEERRERYHTQMSEITSLRTTSIEWKQEQSLKITTKIANGDWQPFNNHKTGYYIDRFGNSEYYSSSWELARMLQLDDSKALWTKKHKIRIPYLDGEGVIRNYVPDILVEDRFLEEIKPTALLEYQFNKLKIDAGIRYCEENNLIYRLINSEHLGNFIEKAIEYHERNNKKKSCS